MRFVIFNLAVLLALGYLLFGSPEKRPIWLTKPEPAAATVVAAPEPAPPVIAKAALPEPELKAESEPRTEPAAVVAPPPPPPPPPPEVVVRDAEPTAPVQEVAVMPVTPVITEPVRPVAEPRMAPLPALMTAQQRRRELGRLADDMEGVFLDKLAR